MTEESGATVVIPGTHHLEPEDVDPADQDIPADQLPPESTHPRVTVECPSGSAVLFHVNLLHGGGANRSDSTRRNVISIWAGPGTSTTTAARYAYQGLYPRSADPDRQRQVQLTFPNLFPESGPRANGGQL